MHAFNVSADELKLIVLRKGSDNEISSQIDGETARKLKNLAGIASDAASGAPLWSAESVTIQSKARRGDTIEVNLILRGLTQQGRALRPGFRIVAGRDLRPGTNEAITSPSMAARFQDCGLGERLNIMGVDFEIVGLRALGFNRRSILMSFLFESVVLCLLGGIVGCLVTLPLNGMSSGTQNATMFSEVTFSFHFGPRVLLQGILLATVMGILGGLAPALRAVRLNIIQALRER